MTKKTALSDFPFREFVAHSLSIINHIGDMRLISQVLIQFGD